MIRFVQRVDFSSKSMDFQSQKSDVFFQGEIKKLMKEISDWQADLVLLSIHNLNELIEKKNYATLISEAFKSIPEVKIIAVNYNDEEKNLNITEMHNSWQEVVNLPNLKILQEFETIFLDDLGLIVHGGFIISEKGYNYLPKLARLDNRWPNLLILPENYLFNCTDKNKMRLEAFDYTTLHPWLDIKGELANSPLLETATEKILNKSFFVKGMLEKGWVRWEI